MRCKCQMSHILQIRGSLLSWSLPDAHLLVITSRGDQGAGGFPCDRAHRFMMFGISKTMLPCLWLPDLNCAIKRRGSDFRGVVRPAKRGHCLRMTAISADICHVFTIPDMHAAIVGRGDKTAIRRPGNGIYLTGKGSGYAVGRPKRSRHRMPLIDLAIYASQSDEHIRMW